MLKDWEEAYRDAVLETDHRKLAEKSTWLQQCSASA